MFLMTASTLLVDSQFCDQKQAEAFIGWLATQTASDRINLHNIEKLSGGAIQQNWLLEIEIAGGRLAGRHKWVLRCDAPSALGISHQRTQEAELLVALADTELAIPRIIALSPQPSPLGKDFFIMGYVEGIAQARKLTRHPDKAQFSDRLVTQLGAEMARLHQITEDEMPLAWLGRPHQSAESTALAEVRAILDRVGGVHPVLEYGYDWLVSHLDDWHQDTDYRLCHRDFRTGNFLVHDGRMTALLDWEFAGWSVPAEDIGWLSARCWRFGEDLAEIGGLGSFSAFAQGYLSVAPAMPSKATIRYWQIFAELRWAAIALEQADRCRKGEVSLELALSAPLAAEMEYNLLAIIASPDITALQLSDGIAHYQMPAADIQAIEAAIEAGHDALDRLAEGSRKNYVSAMIAHGQAMLNRINSAPTAPAAPDDTLELMQKIDAIRQQQQPVEDTGLQVELARYILAKLAVTNPRYHESRPESTRLAGRPER